MWQLGSSTDRRFLLHFFDLWAHWILPDITDADICFLVGRQRMHWSVHSSSLIKFHGLEKLESTRYGIKMALTPSSIHNFSHDGQILSCNHYCWQVGCWSTRMRSRWSLYLGSHCSAGWLARSVPLLLRCVLSHNNVAALCQGKAVTPDPSLLVAFCVIWLFWSFIQYLVDHAVGP